mmetsp:Transcript_28751/g.72249  ORF Transcript_28751/g.72249 Transcript_28751/m.72249 type:complete len:90 (+) Transcript_28751:828-1097(+)
MSKKLSLCQQRAFTGLTNQSSRFGGFVAKKNPSAISCSYARASFGSWTDATSQLGLDAGLEFLPFCASLGWPQSALAGAQPLQSEGAAD